MPADGDAIRLIYVFLALNAVLLEHDPHDDLMAMSTIRNRYVLIPLVLLLSSCQGAGPTKEPEPAQSADWQAVERLGEARFRAPGAGAWAEVAAWSEMPAASRLVTGTGGRLILARPGRQIAIGTKSRLRLPGPERGARLEQTEGRVRYRIAGSPAAFAVATPALDVRATDAVLEVSVGAGGTEVTVEEGEARIATPGGQGMSVVTAGGSARAGGPTDAGLMVRRGPGQGYERVAPVLAASRQPALEPAAKRSLEAVIGASTAARDPAHAATAAAAGPAKRSGGGSAKAAERAQAADDAARELVVVPARFRRAPADRADPPAQLVPDAPDDQAVFTDRPDASDDRIAGPPAGADATRADAQQGTAEDERTLENAPTGTAPAAPPEEPFTRLTDGLLNSLRAVSPTTR